VETIYAIGPVQAPLLPLAPSESELSSCLNYGLQKAAYDIRSSGVLLIQDLHVPCRGSEVTVAEPVPYPLQVDARDQLAVPCAGRHPEPGEDLGWLVRQRGVDPLELRDGRHHDRPGRRVLQPDLLDVEGSNPFAHPSGNAGQKPRS
jgi:hypothetical protein